MERSGQERSEGQNEREDGNLHRWREEGEREQWSGCILAADQRHVSPSVFRQTHK